MRFSTPTEYFDAIWRDYVAITPQAAAIHALFTARGETIINDHIALRTFARPGIELAALARPFERRGFVGRDDYQFPAKHLRARYYQHPDPTLPKVFISELIVERLSAAAVSAVDALCAQLPPAFGDRDDLPVAGRPWRVEHRTYDMLLAESEYAAWVAAFGFRANHFTVDVGQLRTLASLDEVNALVAGAGFELNREGGLVKGTPADYLEQSSTRADEIEVELADGRYRLPSCYYEFARRYRMPSGELFHGFVPGSADKLFHSTDVRR